MGLIRSRTTYDRKRILAEAERARAKGRTRRAVAQYRRILAAEPHNAELHARIAPLLARIGERFDAWQSYRRAAGALLKNKENDAALCLYRESTEALPRQIEAWQWVARLEKAKNRGERARDALLCGRQHQRRRKSTPRAIALLRGALELDPWNLSIVIDLARLLSRSRQAAEAHILLEGMSRRATGVALRKVRAEQWRLEPSLRHSWYWLREALSARSQSRTIAVRGVQ